MQAITVKKLNKIYSLETVEAEGMSADTNRAMYNTLWAIAANAEDEARYYAEGDEENHTKDEARVLAVAYFKMAAENYMRAAAHMPESDARNATARHLAERCRFEATGVIC